jgi:hypothetical protein
VLKQEQEAYEFCQKQLVACNQQLEQYLQQREDRSQGAPLPEDMRKARLGFEVKPRQAADLS